MATMQGVSEVKFQVIRLMRMLVQICQTLETVPEEVRCSFCGTVIERLNCSERAIDHALPAASRARSGTCS